MSNDQTRKFKLRKSRTTLTKAEIADRHLSNFELYLREGDFGKSFSNLSFALSTLPSLKELYYSSFLEVFEPWSTAVEEDHGFQEAVKLYEVALKHYPDSPDVNYLLANILYSIPEEMENELRPGIELWGNVMNMKVEEAGSFSSAKFKCDSVLCLSVAL